MTNCECATWAREAADDFPPHHPRCPSPANVAVWECPNCRERALAGDAPGWRTRPDGTRTHACPDLDRQNARMRAPRVPLNPEGYALAAAVRAMEMWAAAEGREIHPEARPAYAAARLALGLPPSKEDHP